MRFTIVTNVFPSPWLPTKGTFNLELAHELARQHEVSAIVPIPWIDELKRRAFRQKPGAAERMLISDGVTAYFPRYYYPPKIGRNHYASFYWMSIRKTVAKHLRRYRPDAVLGYWAHPDGAAAIRCARELDAAALVMVGGSDVLLLTGDESRRKTIVNSLSQADAVITVSEHLRTRLIELGIHPERVHVIYRGVDTARFSPGNRIEARQRLGITTDRHNLLWVGRMVPVKGLDVLIESCNLLRASGKEFTLHLVGDGPLRQQLTEMVKAKGLAEQVRFAGPVAHRELAVWYRAADITVLPSRSEGVPNVLLESHASGTPFVASNVGGIPEICVDPFDRMVTPDDPRALAAALSSSLAQNTPCGARLESSVPRLSDSAASLSSLAAQVRSSLTCAQSPFVGQSRSLSTF